MKVTQIYLFLGFLSLTECAQLGLGDSSLQPTQRPCPIKRYSKAMAKYRVENKLSSCSGMSANLTKEEKKHFDWACVIKCVWEQYGIFNNQGNLVASGIKEDFTKFTNASNNYITAAQQIYMECKTSSDALISKMKKEGTVVTECRFYDEFDYCTSVGRKKIKDC